MLTLSVALACVAVVLDRLAAMRRREDVEAALMLRHPACLFGHDIREYAPEPDQVCSYSDCVRCRYQLWRRKRRCRPN